MSGKKLKYNGNRYIRQFACKVIAKAGFFYIFGRGHDFKPMKWKRRFQTDSGILPDTAGYMAGQLTMERYPDKSCRIIYRDKENERKFIFFANALAINHVTITELYHNRWQIKLFLKWLKQHLRIKKFWGKTENAVRIQIYSAITACLMMATVQKKMNAERSIYGMPQLVSISLTNTISLRELFAEPNYNYCQWT